MKVKVRHPLPPFFSVSGMLLFLGLGLSWYGYEIMVYEGLLRYWMRDEIVGRIATREFHRNTEWYKFLIEYIPVLLFGGIPWIALVAVHFKSIPWPAARWKEADYWKERTEWLFLFLSFTIPFLLFSVSRSRLPLYVLPLFVPIALALGKAIHWLVENGKVLPARLDRLALAAVLVVMMGKAAMVHWPSHRNMQHLLLEILDAAPGSQRGRLYLVYDHPLYGLHFYLRESFVRVSSKFTRSEPPARLPVSELPGRLRNECAAGATPLILIPKGQQECIRDILPLDLNQHAERETKFSDENGVLESSTGKVVDRMASGAPEAPGSLDVRELESPWVLVFPCGRYP
jgi:4-amino-4-deoxy-L-arabinose transferase